MVQQSQREYAALSSLPTRSARLGDLQNGDPQVNLDARVSFEPEVTISPDKSPTQLLGPNAIPASTRWLSRLLWTGIVAALCYQLGSADLYEPDEGRNAEKARQILVLNDWITPHENFHAVLDKPIFFYWLIAMAYSLFGVSEWAARLPSALAALGCIALVYRFAQPRWGRWLGLWSALILLTSIEFFVLAGRSFST